MREQRQVRMDSELSEEFEVKERMHQRSVLSHFLFAVVVDVVTEFAREGATSELLYAYDFILMSETIKGLRNKFIKSKEVFESKNWKLTSGKPTFNKLLDMPSQRLACLKEKLIHVGLAA